MKKFFSVAENRSDGKLFNFRPALFAAAFFALGILFAYGKKYGAVSSLWLLAGVPIFALSVGFAADRRRALFASGVLVLCFCFGGLSFTRAVQRFKDCGVYAGGHTVVGTIAEKKEYGRFSVLYLTDLYIDGTREQGQLVAAVGASLAEKAALSDEVVLRGTVTTDTDEFGPYGFRAGDIADNVRFKAEAVSLAVTGRDGNLFRAVRFRIKSALYAGMDDDTAAVAYALLTGDVSGIESGLLENVRRGGIAHIFAVSGLHVGALYSFCLLLFNKTRLKRLPKLFRFFFVSAILVFYGGVCGFSASVTRAAVMCLTLYASSLIGTKPDLPESAGLAALFLLIVRPVLLFDVGFQLSFAACLGALPYLPRRFFRSLCARLVRFAKYGGKFFLKAPKGARFPSVRLFGRADCHRAHLASLFRVCLALGTCAQPSLCASRGRGVFLSPRSCVRRSPAAPCRGSYPAVCSFHALVGASAGLLCGRFFFVCRRRNTPRLGRASLLCVFYFSVGQAQSSRAFEKGSFGDNLPFVCGRRVRAQPVKGASAERKKTVKRFSCIFGTNMV